MFSEYALDQAISRRLKKHVHIKGASNCMILEHVTTFAFLQIRPRKGGGGGGGRGSEKWESSQLPDQLGSFILTGLLPRRVRDENNRVILWVMCDC